ncbi:MAG: hypothetical protein JRI94_19855, partial [Deltaproteobacteria bacterium]|nr:hypothetical protein [Deltaproteobacteria bacterium]
NIDRQWHISSFSSLISGIPHGEEIPDRDATGSSDVLETEDIEKWDTGETPAGIFSFPKGAQAGTFMHDIFEHLDFTEKKDAPVKGLVDDKLKKYGFEPMWQETLCRMILKVLAAPLNPEIQGLCLSRIRNQDRLNELEFYFPLKNISPDTLKKIFQTTQGTQIPETFPETMGRLQFATASICYNQGIYERVHRSGFPVPGPFLSCGLEIQSSRKPGGGLRPQIPASSDGKRILHIAISHLHPGPGSVLADHFGGVFYVFLRGVDPEKGSDYGIYRDLPSPELIGALREALLE